MSLSTTTDCCINLPETAITTGSGQDEDVFIQGSEKKPVMVSFNKLNSSQLMAGQGEVVESEDTIVLEMVPIITPNRDIVVPSLSFEVRMRKAHVH